MARRRKLKMTKAAKAARRRYRANKKRTHGKRKLRKGSAAWLKRQNLNARRRAHAYGKKIVAAKKRRHSGRRRPQVSARWKALPKSERLRLGHAIVEQTFGMPLRGRGSSY